MSNVERLCADWLDAKRAEDDARAARYAVEKHIAQAFDVPSEGAKTHVIDNYKVTVAQPVTRKIDLAAWERIKDRVPAEMAPTKIKIEADGAGCKWLANNEPEIWARISSAFETKPGKIAVKVEEK